MLFSYQDQSHEGQKEGNVNSEKVKINIFYLLGEKGFCKSLHYRIYTKLIDEGKRKELCSSRITILIFPYYQGCSKLFKHLTISTGVCGTDYREKSPRDGPKILARGFDS